MLFVKLIALNLTRARKFRLFGGDGDKRRLTIAHYKQKEKNFDFNVFLKFRTPGL